MCSRNSSKLDEIVCSLFVTHLADSSLQHSIQASLRCVHVSGDALAFDDSCELAHISCHAQDVVEAMSRTTADLIVTGEGQRESKEFLIGTFRSVDLQKQSQSK